jgi:hypothetical protein
MINPKAYVLGSKALRLNTGFGGEGLAEIFAHDRKKKVYDLPSIKFTRGTFSF